MLNAARRSCLCAFSASRGFFQAKGDCWGSRPAVSLFSSTIPSATPCEALDVGKLLRRNTSFPEPEAQSLPCLLGSRRRITFHAQRKVIGHRLVRIIASCLGGFRELALSEGPAPSHKARRGRSRRRMRNAFAQEIIKGKHRRRRSPPPKIPIHPSASAASLAALRAVPGATPPVAGDQDMSLFETYRDLQLKWKKTTRQSRKKMQIARKWRHHLSLRPQPEPKWVLCLHPQMQVSTQGQLAVEGSPQSGRRSLRRRRQKSSSAEREGLVSEGDSDVDVDSCPRGEKRGAEESEPQEAAAAEAAGLKVLRPSRSFAFLRVEGTHSQRPPSQLPAFEPGEIFCVFKSSVSSQHKVTVGDVVQTEKLHRRQAGDKVVFGTVLLVGTKGWTLVGKPTIPFARVKAVIEQQTLAGETLSFRYKKTRRSSRLLRVRHWVTMLRIEDIEVDAQMPATDAPLPRPRSLLDLWANRWLFPEELEGIKVDEDGRPLVEKIYDGSEHQPGTYHRRGLAEAYRWFPDPKATHFRR